MAEKSAVLMVVIMKEGTLVGSEVFPPGTYRLGRAPGEDLQLDDPAVSAHHASFALRNGQIGIRDDGSANGLFMNGKKVSVVRVTSKDEVQVGAYTLKMRVLEKKRSGFVEQRAHRPDRRGHGHPAGGPPRAAPSRRRHGPAPGAQPVRLSLGRGCHEHRA